MLNGHVYALFRTYDASFSSSASFRDVVVSGKKLKLIILYNYSFIFLRHFLASLLDILMYCVLIGYTHLAPPLAPANVHNINKLEDKIYYRISTGSGYIICLP